MPTLPQSFSRVTYEETRVQAATTQDLITKLGSNHEYLKNQFDVVLPGNDSANQVTLNGIVARDVNVRLALAAQFQYASSSVFVPRWAILYAKNAPTWSAWFFLSEFRSDDCLHAWIGSQRLIEGNIPLGQKRCYKIGFSAGGGVQTFNVWRVFMV